MDWILLCVMLNIGLAFIPANMAKKKGYSFGGFWCLTFFLSFVVGLIVAAVLEDKHYEGYPKRYCTQCGAQIVDNTAFCGECGAKVLVDTGSGPVQQNRFLTHYLGLVVLGLMLFVALTMGTMSMHFYNPMNILNVFRMLVPYSLLALAVLISARSKGIDISLGGVLVLGMTVTAFVAMQGSVVSGISIGLLACAAVGLVNGAITVYLKVPSLIPTVLMTVILRFVNIALTEGRPIPLEKSVPMMLSSGFPIGLITILPFAIIVTVVLIQFSKLREPMDDRSAVDTYRPVYMLSYMVGSILAGVSGICLMFRLRVALPIQSIQFVVFIVLVFAVIMSTRLTNNPVGSVFIALGTALTYQFLLNAMVLQNVDSYWQMIMSILFTVIFVAISIIVRKDTLKRMMQFK